MKPIYKIVIITTLILISALSIALPVLAESATINPSQASDTLRAGFNGSAWAVTTEYISAGYSTSAYYRMRNGIRFNGVPTPRGATITSAHITFTAYPATTSTVAVNSVLQGEASDNARAFSSYDNFNTRPKTTNDVHWDSIPVWTSESTYTSPDVSPIIREIISRPNWSTGNSIVIFWGDEADRTPHINTSYRIAYSYKANAAKAPRLRIEYTLPAPVITPMPTPATPTPTITTADISNQIVNLNNLIVGLQSQVAAIQGASGDTSDLAKTLSSVTTTIAQITQTANTINSGVNNLATKVTAMSDNQNKLQAELNNTRADLKIVTGKISELQSQSGRLMTTTIIGFLVVLLAIGAVVLFIKQKIL